MSNADKRTVHTDALETLGMIHYKEEHRDAIHLAVEPVEAGMELKPGQRIGIIDGKAYPTGHFMARDPLDQGAVAVPDHGIVDPFLSTNVRTGQKFWFIMRPRMVSSLRHVWEHPDFPEGK